MTKTEILTRFAVDDASRIALARVLDKAQLAQSRNIPAYSQFLTDGEQELADQAVNAMGNPRRVLWGGYEAAQRRVCVFLPDWMEAFVPGGEDDPLAAVEVTAPHQDVKAARHIPGGSVQAGSAGPRLAHRDYLGALMGLGLAREGLGDILVAPDRAQVVCLKSVLPALLTQWTEVGRYAVKVRELPLSELRPVAGDVKIRRETFQSLRLDAVAAAGFGLSRAKAAGLIAAGRILVNHLPCQKSDRLLKEGDSLTAKGYGKCVLAHVLGESRKGRIMVEMERYR